MDEDITGLLDLAACDGTENVCSVTSAPARGALLLGDGCGGDFISASGCSE